MSCCGRPNTNENDANRQMQAQTTMVTQQPGLQPSLGFQTPAITTPTPTYAANVNAVNTWSHSPSPPPGPGMNGMMMNNLQSSTPIPTTYSATINGSSSYSTTEPLIRPDAIYPGYGSSSPPLSLNTGIPPSVPQIASKPVDEGKMSIAFDFGTTFSGVAYGSARVTAGKVQQILNWPGSTETFRKIPTCLLYDGHGQVLAWGLEAKNASPMAGTIRCEWFKLYLEPHALRDESAVDPRLPRLPPGKKPIDLIIDFLSCLWEYAKDQITREIGAVADLNSADVWLTVPAAWDAKGCDIMREAAITAGLVQNAHAGDRTWRDRLHIITEPEAAAVHCAFLTNVHHLKPSQNFMIVDAGGGTCDLAVYKIIGQMANLEIAEMCARSGANCGSLFLDLRFRELVKTLLADHPAHLDPASLAYFMHSFSETDKLTYKGLSDDNNMFHFTCFNVEDPHDPSVGLIDGQLCIPGNLLREKVFDPVVSQVLSLIEDQIKKVDQPIHALLLVGGFAGSEYLKHCVEVQFESRIRIITRPPDADTATLRGAAQYGLAKRQLVSTVIAPRSYIMKVKLPAEKDDWHKRPAYIRNNDAGVAICDNRLQYLVTKGAILRKGQRLTTKFCKFSQSVQDSSFVATLFTSDSEKLMRYTDEGETTELCKWTVDLSSLPTFRQNAMHQSGGFYTEFELGLELDSAEVRGILLYNNQEWGRVTFDFIN
ncbi:hypothetical protein AMATHDRAFT_71166 [Amanita thiersii Skay4041]|uniref:Actin-like ATPase domain-containing protein n=1 Tax=Amanita thiersii Skay4041 TaxID=703135 RepID=A0A2A9NDF1_9AGAR|nr:hypothetical protein AMATHDRAFT_71166 [Amanita thiersii Skay4041]